MYEKDWLTERILTTSVHSRHHWRLQFHGSNLPSADRAVLICPIGATCGGERDGASVRGGQLGWSRYIINI